MVYSSNLDKAMSIEQYGNKLINEDLAPLVDSNSYLAFFVLSAAIEFITRCRLRNLHYEKNTAVKYVSTIDCVEAFRPYSKFKYKKGQYYTNYLYTAMRCGLLHTGLPNKGIILSSNYNELDKNVIGCRSLYEDIKKAWEEIKKDPQVISFIRNNKAIVISETLIDNKP